MKPAPEELIYTILANDRPVVALEARRYAARKLCKDGWFRNELSTMKFKGEPLVSPGSRLRARPAVESEWEKYDRADRATQDTKEVLFVLLVELDNE